MSDLSSSPVPSVRSRRGRRLAVGAVALLAASAGLVTPAWAKDGSSGSGSGSGGNDREVRASGACATGRWELKAKADDGRLEVEFELDTNRNGQTWAVTITDNGTSVFSGNRTTVAPSGSFEIGVHPANRTGADRIVATARRGGQTCTGTVTI